MNTEFSRELSDCLGCILVMIGLRDMKIFKGIAIDPPGFYLSVIQGLVDGVYTAGTHVVTYLHLKYVHLDNF